MLFNYEKYFVCKFVIRKIKVVCTLYTRLPNDFCCYVLDQSLLLILLVQSENITSLDVDKVNPSKKVHWFMLKLPQTKK